MFLQDCPQVFTSEEYKTRSSANITCALNTSKKLAWVTRREIPFSPAQNLGITSFMTALGRRLYNCSKLVYMLLALILAIVIFIASQ